MKNINELLNNKSWLRENVRTTCECASYNNPRCQVFTIKSLHFIPQLSQNIETLKDGSFRFTKNSILVFLETNKKCFYKFYVTENIRDSAELNLYFLIKVLNVYQPNEFNVKFSLIITNDIFLKSRIKSKKEFLYHYISDNKDKFPLTVTISEIKQFSEILNLYRLCNFDKCKYVPDKTPYEFIHTMIINDISSNYDSDYSSFEYVCKHYYHEYYDNEYRKFIEKYKKLNDLYIRFLLDQFERFSSVFRITFNYNGFHSPNKIGSVYDSVNLEINMLNGYNENIIFIKRNAGKIIEIINTIVKLHSVTKSYDLKLCNLQLSAGNILMAHFKINE